MHTLKDDNPRWCSGKGSTCQYRIHLGLEDSLEEEMTTHSSTHGWKIPWTKIVVGYSLCSLKEMDMTETEHACILKNSMPLYFFISEQCSQKLFSISLLYNLYYKWQ